jgi:hypothetical protein
VEPRPWATVRKTGVAVIAMFGQGLLPSDHAGEQIAVDMEAIAEPNVLGCHQRDEPEGDQAQGNSISNLMQQVANRR